MTWEHEEKWFEQCSKLVGFQATEANPMGLMKAADWYIKRLNELRFDVQTIENPDAIHRPIIVAVRKPKSSEDGYIGFFQHYDVEPLHRNWSSNPWKLTQRDGRAFGRGMADNIGPFVQRLLVLEHSRTDSGIVFVIQGEEEIGSPFADAVYPTLELPDVDLWIEETGYFYKNKSQRVMTVGSHAILDKIITALGEINEQHGAKTQHRHRPLNKAFGAERCPCLAHLVKNAPYLAIGPNDDHSTVHGPNESIALDLLERSAQHLLAVFSVMEGSE